MRVTDFLNLHTSELQQQPKSSEKINCGLYWFWGQICAICARNYFLVMHCKIRDKENKKELDDMASNKFVLSSGSPDKPLYGSGNRGSYSMDRSGSFRETVDNSVSSSLPNLSRNNSSVGQSEVLNFLQCLPHGSKPMFVDLRSSSRQGNLRRNIDVAFGISPDNSPSSEGKLVAPPSQEELKRVKAGLRECSSKARERIKFFDESISIINKFFPSVSTKGRSQSEVLSCDRSGPTLSNGRPMHGQGHGKVGLQNNIISSNYDMQKTEERPKKIIPSRRRTSLADVKDMRGYGSMSSSGPTAREKELPKLANGGSVQSDDRTLPIGDGWEKSKMKKKRSIIKLDSAAVSTKPLDGYREPKQGIQQRSINNARPRLNSDSHGPRSGTGNGVLGAAKSDVLSQQMGLPSRASKSMVDNDRDKGRVNIKAVNKVKCRDEFNFSNPTSNSRMSTPVRAPRSSSSAVPKLASMTNRAFVSNEWEIGNCTNRPPTAVGDNNHKRTASTRSSSPPSFELCTRKLQKTNRGRRMNPGPAASSNEASPMDSGNESGLGFPRRMPVSSPQLVKLKGEFLSSSPISEGEDSGDAEMKTRDRVKRSDEVEEKSAHHFQKLSSIAVSSRKNKSVSGEANGDGSRRHGRAGRGFVSSRSLLPMLGHEETAKQLRSARIGTDKIESKAGRPPTRRLSGRKAFPQQKHTSVNSPADFPVVSDDGDEELLAAANAVINPTNVSHQSFWSEKEPLFDFISDVDINFLKQENVGPAFRMQNHTHINTDHCMGSGVFGVVETVGDDSIVSLSERLLAALIPEEEEADYCISDTDDLIVDDTDESRHEFDGNLESNGFSFESIESSSTNGYMQDYYHEHGNGILRTISNSGFDCPTNGLVVADQETIADREGFRSSYDNMDINERLLLEMHSVGIFPNLLPNRPQTGGINDEISELMEEHQIEASKKKQTLDKLLTSTLETRDSQEQEFEQLALDKLVGMAYRKYMMCCGHGSGGKNSNTKMVKEAALAFVKRTLERSNEFEGTGKSCFSDPLFKDIFESGSSRLSLARSLTDTNGEASKRPRQNTDQSGVRSDVPMNNLPDQTTDKEETWLNCVKKRVLFLDDVVGNAIGNSFTSPSGMASALVSSTKGKRSERDREGKSGNSKSSGRSSGKVERKPKAKQKQKAAQLSVSINGLLSTTLDESKQALASGSKSNEKVEVHNPLIDDDTEEVLDFSNLQLPGMDVLGCVDDCQGEDLASWLNMDDDNLQDHDDFLGLEGLEIPMDDLSDLNMMV